MWRLVTCMGDWERTTVTDVDGVGVGIRLVECETIKVGGYVVGGPTIEEPRGQSGLYLVERGRVRGC